MATKIKRCLYIGLGGTGMKSLLHTKKMFIDTYGEVPPMIGFLGIDTDGGEYSKKLLSAMGEDVTILKNEQLPIQVQDARPIYERQKAHFSWIPEKNIYSLSSMMLGAGQVRSNGRFAFTVNKDNVKLAIKNKLNEIQNARIINNSDYELLNTSEPEIHMVFSICGGTGSGTFLNMAYLLREVAPMSKINGYAVLPEVFESMTSTGMAKVKPNAYGALVDLDYLMHRSMNDTPILIDYLNGEQYEINGRPFNSMVFIDNKNKDGHTYTDVNQLTEMVSLALITASGELSVAGAAVGDNLEKNISEGSMNIEDKVAWAGGMGACEIVYKGEALSEIYKMKAAQNIIDRMFNTCSDANMIANAWIDSADVHIRENNGQDHVTDYICSKEPRYQLEISNYKDPSREVNDIIERNRIKDEDVTAKVEALLTKVRTELRKLLVANINEECGISSAQNIIEELKIQIGICLQEMKAEKEELVAKKAPAKSAVETAIIDLKDYAGRIFSGKGGKEQRAADVAEAVRQYCSTLLDIQRHDAAITFYNSILVNFNESENKISNIAESLKAVKSNLTQKINTLQKGVSDDETIFQINLASEDAKRVTVKSEDVRIPEFVSSLSGDLKIYGFTEYSAAEIEAMIMDYTKTLPLASVYMNKSIEDIFDQILKKENGQAEFQEIITRAVSKSMPLFRYDHDGYFPVEQPSDIFYVGVFNAKNSLLVEEDRFKSLIAGNPNVSFASTGMKGKVIIYRQVGVVPVYAIVGIKNFERAYNDCKACVCHFDANILRRMERDNFTIYPTATNNNDMLDLWVKGFVYGLLKNENKCYYMKSESLGDYLDDYWVKLAEWRDEAFEEFKRHELNVVKDFNAYISAENERVGAEATRQLIERVKANYFDEFSQIKIQKPTLKQKGYEKVAELMKMEGAHVLKNL